MGNIKLKKMKFAVAALLFASSSAVKLQDDCGGKWCNQGLPYDLDEGTLRKAEADNVAKTDWYEHTKLALEIAQNAHAASTAASKAAAAADSAAGTAKSAASAAKASSDANLLANQKRVAFEKDQLLRGQNQDRLKFVNGDTAVATSAIQSRHWERQASNGNLLKSLASF